jgi:hypothetical protein
MLDRGLQDAQVNRLTLTEFIEVKLLQAIVKSTEAGELGVECEAAVVRHFPVVLMKPERDGLKRARGEITFDVLLRHRFILGVWGLHREGRSEADATKGQSQDVS